MIERKDYVIDTSKIKTLKDVRNIFECLGIICDISILEENDPRYELAKEYFVIPYVEEPRKSLEELSQELNEKIDKLITKTKNNFYASKTFAESRYEKKFDKIFDNFEYAKENGQFPLKFTLDYSKFIATGSNITSNFEIRSGAEQVGYYTIGNGYLRYYMNQKPNFVVRFCMDKLLNFRWIDV